MAAWPDSDGGCRRNLQLDDTQQVLLGRLQDGAAPTEVAGVTLSPAVHILEHLGGRALHRHTLFKTGLSDR